MSQRHPVIVVDDAMSDSIALNCHLRETADSNVTYFIVSRLKIRFYDLLTKTITRRTDDLK